MTRKIAAIFLLLALLPGAAALAAPLSDDSQACVDCHAQATPGIVAAWQASRHAQTTPAQAMKLGGLAAKLSASAPPPEALATSVGCAECHTANADSHPDSFEHQGFQVHAVVSPADCARCHPVESRQFQQNLMAHARGNLVDNPLYMDLAAQVNGVQQVDGAAIAVTPAEPNDEAESCIYCHGSAVRVVGQITRQTDYGEMTFAKLDGWPNHGVGRLNPDGVKGSCAACHSRHRFSMAVARSAYSCAECHKGPDVPAFKVYEVSRHGALFFAQHKDWDMNKTPWEPGKDFSAPTCAVCHVSLLADGEGNVIAQRSHAMNERIWLRLLGLIQSHPHPKSPQTSLIRNADGQPLATTLDGRPATAFLIDQAEQDKRRQTMRRVCLACHGQQWVDGQLARIDAVSQSADAMVLAASKLVRRAWQDGLAQGPAQGGSPFDEYIERLWVEQWLMHANGARFAAAMMGPDLGVFESGRWPMAKNIRQMQDWLIQRKGEK